MSATPAAASESAKRSPGTARALATPLMRQYLSVKQEHREAFLFFRLGDFYEMFFDDAVRGAALLGLTLTSRNKSDPDPIPMCGIPWHQRDGYVARLLRLGHKVAICDQLVEPDGRTLVERGVTEVLTPGSVTAEAFLDAAANNELVALWPGDTRLGVCVTDASTGEVRLAEPTWEDVPALLGRIRAAEWLLPEERGDDSRLAAALRGLAGARTMLPAERFLGAPDARGRWPERVRDLGDLEAAWVAASAAVDYLVRMQGGAARQLTRLERWGDDDTLRYDAATARHLELFDPQPGGAPNHTLWHLLDRTVTAPGARRLRAWIERPLVDLERLASRHDAVAAWTANGAARAALRSSLRGFPDLERLASRLACARATPRDLGAIRDALGKLPVVRDAIAGLEGFMDVDDTLAGVPELEERLRAALVDEPPPGAREGGIVRPGYDADRDALDDLAHSGKRWIAELEATERTRTGIASLRVGYNRVFGYYLEVTRPQLPKVPADWERRQTLTSAERFVTPALKVKEGEVLSAQDRLVAREIALFEALRDAAAAHVPALQRIAAFLAARDAEATLGEVAVQHGWVRPEMDGGDTLALEASRHPVVERLLPGGAFVPNHVDLGGARQIQLVTGPNMGGKSTYLRQVALIALLAQAGSFVPAKRARIGVVDRLFTRVGAGDRLGAGESTFRVEMRETAEILKSATPRSLVVLDEVGRGTATYDGLAIAWAVTEFLHAAEGPRPRTLFATHYHELTQLSETLPRLVNVHVLVEEWQDQVVFLHKIADGAADRSYGIHVAQLAGLPSAVIARAREVLEELEEERTVEQLAAPKAARRAAKEKRAEDQLGLFGTAEHPLAAELRGIDPNALTPLEALRRLAEWKERWGR